MKKAELQKHKFDGRIRLAVFFGLITFAFMLQLAQSQFVGEVVAAILVLAGVSKSAGQD